MSGPLAGVRIIEFAGLGPGPFAATMLADHGAEVIRIERQGGVYSASGADPDLDVMMRSRLKVTVDLKAPRGLELVRKLCQTADGLIEGYRPGTMERFGLGPADLLQDNPKLIYGRMTGWGQEGELAYTPGHDINYIALSGVLSALGRAGEKPTPPMNLLGDYGGGLMMAFGMVSALLHAQKTGRGQVVDCAMVDSAAMLGSVLWTFMAQNNWTGPRGTNLLDTGAPYYDTYECSDGEFIAVGPVEPQFYAVFRELLGVDSDPDFDSQEEASNWPFLKEKLARLFKTRSRSEWCDLLEGSDACATPVLSPTEAARHPHNLARRTFLEIDGVLQPAPAPRFSETKSNDPTGCISSRKNNNHLLALLSDLGYSDDGMRSLMAEGSVG